MKDPGQKDDEFCGASESIEEKFFMMFMFAISNSSPLGQESLKFFPSL